MADDQERFNEDPTDSEHERTRNILAMVAGGSAIESLNGVRTALQSAAEVSLSDDLKDNFEATKTQIDRICLAESLTDLAISQLRIFHNQLADMSLRVGVGFHLEELSVAKGSFLGSFDSKNVREMIATCGRAIAVAEATIAECEKRISGSD